MKKFQKLAAVVAASGALAGTGVVTATIVPAVAQEALPAPLVDQNKLGVIHLTKYDDAVPAQAADGTNTPPQGANPLAGIGFTLQKINGVDFSTNEGLEAAAALNPSEISADRLGEAISGETNAEGKIDFDNLEVGAYLLTETDSVAADGKEYKAAKPSIVFVPTTNPVDQSSWIEEGDKYAVYVFPKNSVDENEKTVTDADVQAGDLVNFEVSASIPAASGDNQLVDFGFFDTLDPALELTADTAGVQVTAGDAVLTEAAGDLVVWITETETGQDKLTVVATPQGLEKIAAAKAANSQATAVLSFNAKVNGAAVVPNQATVFKNTGTGEGTLLPDPDNPPTTPPEEPEGSQETNTTVSAWGRVNIAKTNENGDRLDGAEFQVYRCTITDEEAEVTGDPITVVSTTEGADNIDGNTYRDTNNDGTIVIDGLHVNDVENNADVDPTNYCLVETKAPEGYELRQEPIPFQVTLGGVQTATERFEYDENGVLTSYSSENTLETFDVEGVNLVVEEEVVNIEAKPKLPLTGGAGIAIFGLLGSLIIAGGLFAAKRNSGRA